MIRLGLGLLLPGGHRRRLRHAGLVADAASRRPERLEELVRGVVSTGEIVRMRASGALEKVCRPGPRRLPRFVPRLPGERSRIGQASVQRHLAQIPAEVPPDEEQQAQAVTIREHNLGTPGDWIVINLTLEALAGFARASPAVRARPTGRLHHCRHSPHKSAAARARKLLAEFGTTPPPARPPARPTT